MEGEDAGDEVNEEVKVINRYPPWVFMLSEPGKWRVSSRLGLDMIHILKGSLWMLHEEWALEASGRPIRRLSK